MVRPTRASALPAAAVGAVLLVLAARAGVSSVGGSLPAGSSVCTDRTRSSAQVTWTVTAASTFGGAETQVFRAVAPPRPGALFYRTCLTNTTRSAVSFSTVSTSPRAGAGGQSNIGPTTAVLGPEGTAGGERIQSQGHLTASSSVPVTWWIRVFNGDGPILRQIKPLTVIATSVDQVVGPGAYASLDVCVINHSSATATMSMQLAAS